MNTVSFEEIPVEYQEYVLEILQLCFMHAIGNSKPRTIWGKINSDNNE